MYDIQNIVCVSYQIKAFNGMLGHRKYGIRILFFYYEKVINNEVFYNRNIHINFL